MTSTAVNNKSTSQSEHVARSAGIVSLAIGLSRITGLVREVVMARLFGAGFAYDAFLLGFRIPNLTRNLFAEGALSSAFIPAFAASLAKQGRKEAAELSNLVGTAILVIVGIVCVLGMIFSPQLVWLLAPGFAAVPGKFPLAVHMTRIMFPFLLLVALAAQAMGMLNACDRFGVPAMASAFFNLGSVIFGVVLGYWLGPHIGITGIEGMAYGVVIGGAIQLAWQFPSLHRLGFDFKLAFNWSHPGLQRIFRLMIPAILGNAAVQINVMVNTNFASRISDPLRGFDGPVSWLAYSFRFMQLPVGLFGAAFASAMLPSISRSAEAENLPEFRHTLSRSLGMVFLLSIPSSLGLAILGRPIIGAIFQGGRFDAYDTRQTALALSAYAIGLLGYAAMKILSPAFYALNDARTPMYLSLLSILANFIVAFAMVIEFHLGPAALALSTSIVAIFSSLLLFELLRRKLGGIEGRYVFNRFARICAASLVMALPLFFLHTQVTRYFPATRLVYLGELAVGLPLGIAIFFFASRFLRIQEIDSASRVFIGPLRRKLHGVRAKIQN